jgi:hypothetical protein
MYSPSKGAAVSEEGVLLLNTVPRHLIKTLVKNGLGVGAGAGGDGGHVGLEHLAEHKDVVAFPHGVLAHEGGLEEDLRVVARGLASAGTIVVPQGKLVDGLGHGVEDASLATAKVQELNTRSRHK